MMMLSLPSPRVMCCMPIIALVLALCTISSLPDCVDAYRTPSRFHAWNNAIHPTLFRLLKQEIEIVAKYEETQETLRKGKRKTRWFPLGERPKTVIEETILRLREITKPYMRAPLAGMEWWVQRVDAGTRGTIGFHLDKDEAVASDKMYLLHPEWSSITYITDVGGCTLITDQHSPDGNGYQPADPEEGELVCPRANRYVIFNGTLLHGVLPGRADHVSGAREAGELPSDGKRVTFLVNWWDRKPELPNCDLFPHEQVPGLKLLSKKGLKALRDRLARVEEGDVSDDDLEEDEQDQDDAENFKTPSKQPTTLIDFTRPDHRPDHYDYTIPMPGTGTQHVLLPTNISRKGAYSFMWKATRENSKDRAKLQMASRRSAKDEL